LNTAEQNTKCNIFFTVNCAERIGNSLLTDNIDELRRALRKVKDHHPFEIDAIDPTQASMRMCVEAFIQQIGQMCRISNSMAVNNAIDAVRASPHPTDCDVPS